jgi:Spy/CpxP family protein refolding chaperone
MGPQQVQELIDAYALVEAERMLQMTDQQYAQFVAKATRLHRIRRQAILERQRALRELAAIVTAPGAPREEAVAEKLKALDEASERLGVAVRQALADVDSVLTVVQRARYRVLEEQLERRKIELLNRALGARDPRTPDGRGAPSRGPGGEGS